MIDYNFIAAASLPGFLTSGTAIMIYIFILLGAIIALVATVLFKESKSGTSAEELGNRIVINAPAAEKADKKDEKPDRTRFFMLTEIEQRKKKYMRSVYDKNVTLESFCED
ncbi:MAG: hypothetical protein J6V80_01070, partial [Clostridia bacterium]|nr:hypothetical protein [Clostridia bacterium]